MERFNRVSIKELSFEQRAGLFVEKLLRVFAYPLLADPADRATAERIAWEIIQLHGGSLSPAERKVTKASIIRARESMLESLKYDTNRFACETVWLEAVYFGEEMRVAA